MLSQTPLLIPTNEDYYYNTLNKLIFTDTHLLSKLITFLEDYHKEYSDAFENFAHDLQSNLKRPNALKDTLKILLGLNDDPDPSLAKYDINFKKIAGNPDFIALVNRTEKYIFFQQNSYHKNTLNEKLNHFAKRAFQLARSQKGEWEIFWKQKKLQNAKFILVENYLTAIIFSAILHLFNAVRNKQNVFSEKFHAYAEDFTDYLQTRNCSHLGEYFDECIEGRLFLRPGATFRPQPQRLFEDKEISSQFSRVINEFTPVLSKQNIKNIKEQIDHLFLNVIFKNVTWMLFWEDQEKRIRKIKEQTAESEIEIYIKKVKTKIGAAFIYALLCQSDQILPVDHEKKIVLTFILTSYYKEPKEIEKNYFFDLAFHLEKTLLAALTRDSMLEKKTSQEVVNELCNNCKVLIKKHRFSSDNKKMQAIALHFLFSRLLGEKTPLASDKKNIVSQVIIKLIGELDIKLDLYNYNLLEKTTEYFTRREPTIIRASDTGLAKPGSPSSRRISPRVSGVKTSLNRKSAHEFKQFESDPQLKKSHSGDLRNKSHISPRDFISPKDFSSASSSSSRTSPRETASPVTSFSSPRKTTSTGTSFSSHTSSQASSREKLYLPLPSSSLTRTQEPALSSPRKSPRDNGNTTSVSLPNSPISSPRSSKQNMIQSEPTTKLGGVTFDFFQRIPSKYNNDLTNSKKYTTLFSSEIPFLLDSAYIETIDLGLIKKIKKIAYQIAAKHKGNLHLCFNAEGTLIENTFKANTKIVEDNKTRKLGKKVLRYELLVIKKEKITVLYMLDFNFKNIFHGAGGITFIAHKIKDNNKDDSFPDIVVAKFMHSRKYDRESFKIIEENYILKQRYIGSCENGLGEFILISKFFPGFTLSNIMYDIEKKPYGNEINHGRRYIRPEQKISLLMSLLHAYIEFAFEDHVEMVHRDIKPANFILKDKSTTIIDIDEITRKYNLDDNFYGSNGYFSPKINPAHDNEKTFYSFEDDVYALGILMFELLSYNNYAKAISSKIINCSQNAMMSEMTLSNKEMLETLSDVCEITDLRQRLDLTSLRIGEETLRQNWLNLSRIQIMTCLQPLFKNIIEEDKKIFASSKKYIFEEMFYQLYSFSVIHETLRPLISENEKARPKTKKEFKEIENKLYGALRTYLLSAADYFKLYEARDECLEEVISLGKIHIMFSPKNKNHPSDKPPEKTHELSKGSRGSSKGW